jgi:hypothetical protein
VSGTNQQLQFRWHKDIVEGDLSKKLPFEDQLFALQRFGSLAGFLRPDVDLQGFTTQVSG